MPVTLKLVVTFFTDMELYQASAKTLQKVLLVTNLPPDLMVKLWQALVQCDFRELKAHLSKGWAR
eukprot:m.302157 g.302157  ORF g.302157 m.302157 type:complete len:65 (+) comp40812_c0_seq15:3600-3794(+)